MLTKAPEATLMTTSGSPGHSYLEALSSSLLSTPGLAFIVYLEPIELGLVNTWSSHNY